MKIKKFKEEFRYITTDTWADALDAWFEVAGQLYLRGITPPDIWDYKPACKVGDVEYRHVLLNDDCYFHEMFDNASTEDLKVLGDYLFRYCQHLKYYGMNY